MTQTYISNADNQDQIHFYDFYTNSMTPQWNWASLCLWFLAKQLKWLQPKTDSKFLRSKTPNLDTNLQESLHRKTMQKQI